MRRLTVLLLCNLACNGGKQQPPPQQPREIEVLTLAPSEVRETGTYLGSLLSRCTPIPGWASSNTRAQNPSTNSR